MTNIIVVSFKEEAEAIEALQKIRDLDRYGDITLYEYIMIRKKDDNAYEVLSDKTAGKGWRVLTGTALGGLVGALAGPVGITLGLLTGTTLGAVFDHRNLDFESKFVKKINNKMHPGDIAIIAEVSEGSTAFIDTILKPFNAEITRTETDIEYDDYVESQFTDLEDEIEEQRKKLKVATAQEKEKIQTLITDLKVKRKDKMAKVQTKGKSTMHELREKTKAQLKKLQLSLENFDDSVSDNITQIKANRLKKRIERQESRLTKLNQQLEEVADE